MTAASDVSLLALRHCIDGDVPGAFTALTDHIYAADNPRQEMFVIAWGYATALPDDLMFLFDGLEDPGLARVMVMANRSDDAEGAWMVWRDVSAGACGSVLGGLLAAAAQNVMRDAGLL